MHVSHGVPECFVCGVGQSGETEDVHGRLWTGVRPQHDFSDDAECASAAATDREEYAGVLIGVGGYDCAVGEDDGRFEQVVTAHTVCAGEETMAATCEPAHDADAGVCAADDDLAKRVEKCLDLAVGMTGCYADCRERVWV